MFTGIIQQIATVESINSKHGDIQCVFSLGNDSLISISVNLLTASSFELIESICALSSVASFPLPIVRAFLNIFKFQLVPCSQESRYLICSSDNISNSPPIRLNFVAAILISTSLGNVYTFDSSFL